MKKGLLRADVHPPRGWKITRAWLEKYDACDRSLKLFAKEWPNGVVLSREMLLRAAAIGINVAWVLYTFLSQEACESYRTQIEQSSLLNRRVQEIATNRDITNAQRKALGLD